MENYFTFEFYRDFWRATAETAAARGLRLFTIVILYWFTRIVLYRIIDATLHRFVARTNDGVPTEDRLNRIRTLQGVVKNLVGYVLAFILVIMVLQAVSVDVTGIITTASVGGLAIGIGAQRIVRDVIAGFFFIVEDQFAVGEYVSICGPAGTLASMGVTGTVVEIGLRITQLRDEQGRLWTLANGDITAVLNPSRAEQEGWIEIDILPSADVKHVEEVINSVGVEMSEDPNCGLLKPAVSLGVSSFDPTRTVIRVSTIAEPRSMSAVQLRLREAIRTRLLREGIALT